MDRLREKYLNVPLEAVLHPASEVARREATRQKTRAAKAPSVPKNQLTAEHWFERGVQAADPDEKIRLYTLAIRLKRDYSVAYNNRGVAHDDKGDTEAALEDYDEAIRLDSSDATTWNDRGYIRKEQGDDAGAVADLEEAIRLNPSYAMAFNNRGYICQQHGDFDGALADYEEAIRLDPNLGMAARNRSQLLEKMRGQRSFRRSSS